MLKVCQIFKNEHEKFCKFFLMGTKSVVYSFWITSIRMADFSKWAQKKWQIFQNKHKKCVIFFKMSAKSVADFLNECKNPGRYFKMSAKSVADISKWALKVVEIFKIELVKVWQIFQNKHKKCGRYFQMSTKSVADC